jgi:hypothetical protein
MTIPMNIRRLALDVDKAIAKPSVIELATAVNGCRGVEGFNITVSEIDLETVGMDFTIEGQHLDYDELASAIEKTGAVVHSIDQIVCGERMVEQVVRTR